MRNSINSCTLRHKGVARDPRMPRKCSESGSSSPGVAREYSPRPFRPTLGGRNALETGLRTPRAACQAAWQHAKPPWRLAWGALQAALQAAWGGFGHVWPCFPGILPRKADRRPDRQPPGRLQETPALFPLPCALSPARTPPNSPGGVFTPKNTLFPETS